MLALLPPPSARGLVSGDCLSVSAEAEDGAKALVTTPAMTKVYMADSHHVRQSETISLKVRGSDLEWLPQGVIFFDGSDAAFDLAADLDEESSLFALSLNVFGRKENAEDFVSARCAYDRDHPLRRAAHHRAHGALPGVPGDALPGLALRLWRVRLALCRGPSWR